jgi:hypothetical protein
LSKETRDGSSHTLVKKKINQQIKKKAKVETEEAALHLNVRNNPTIR